MKNKILTWLALSVIFCLSSFETKAQSVYIQDIIEYIDKNGQEFDALIGVRGIRYTESLNLPKVTVLEGDYIVMKATSCTYVGSVEGGHLYKLHLEIAPAMDFGERFPPSFPQACQTRDRPEFGQKVASVSHDKSEFHLLFYGRNRISYRLF